MVTKREQGWPYLYQTKYTLGQKLLQEMLYNDKWVNFITMKDITIIHM